jgi:hypothetical protein
MILLQNARIREISFMDTSVGITIKNNLYRTGRMFKLRKNIRIGDPELKAKKLSIYLRILSDISKQFGKDASHITTFEDMEKFYMEHHMHLVPYEDAPRNVKFWYSQKMYEKKPYYGLTRDKKDLSFDILLEYEWMPIKSPRKKDVRISETGEFICPTLGGGYTRGGGYRSFFKKDGVNHPLMRSEEYLKSPYVKSGRGKKIKIVK